MYNHGERTKVGIRLSCYTFEFENNMPQPVLDTQKSQQSNVRFGLVNSIKFTWFAHAVQAHATHRSKFYFSVYNHLLSKLFNLIAVDFFVCIPKYTLVFTSLRTLEM